MCEESDKAWGSSSFGTARKLHVSQSALKLLVRFASTCLKQDQI